MAFDTGQQGGRPALLHPRRCASPRGRRRAARRVRPGVDVPPGHVQRVRGRRGRPGPGGRGAQPPGLATARTMSFFRLVEPRTSRPVTRRAGARGLRRDAEGWLERSRDGDADPSWLGFYSYDRFAADAAGCYRDLKAPRQVRRFTEAGPCPGRSEEYVRSHGLRLVVSAVAELESGNLDAACAAGARRWRSPGGSRRRGPPSTYGTRCTGWSRTATSRAWRSCGSAPGRSCRHRRNPRRPYRATLYRPRRAVPRSAVCTVPSRGTRPTWRDPCPTPSPPWFNGVVSGASALSGWRWHRCPGSAEACSTATSW